MHRNTVVAAYAELATQGWVKTHSGGGTFVSDELPEPEPRHFSRGVSAKGAMAQRPAFDVLPAPRLPPPAEGLAPGTLAMWGGVPDLRMVPGPAVARAYRRVPSRAGPRLLAAFRRAGAELVGVRVDRYGIDTKALARLLEARPVRAIYVTPHHHYPTTVVMSPARRLALLELAARHRVAIIEDDYDHEFHYDGRPVLPLASADPAGVVIYVGTLSKILAPGLRLGFAIAPEPLILRLANERFISDRQGDRVLEAAVADLMEDGELSIHVRRMRNVCRARRDALVASLERRFGTQLEYQVPAGGMALWAHAPGVDVVAWQARAFEHKVAFAGAHDYSFRRTRRPCLRLGFASLDESEFDEATRRLSAALPPA